MCTEQHWQSPEWDCDSFPLPPQIRSVIRRSRETGHAHPMSREPSPRRRLDPATLSRTPSQERLIAELQGRLGIQPEVEDAARAAGASTEDWMTEGVVITVQPRGRRAGGQLVEKVVGRCPGLGQGQVSRPSDSSPALAGGEVVCVCVEGGGPGPVSRGPVRLVSFLVSEWEGLGEPGTPPLPAPAC